MGESETPKIHKESIFILTSYHLLIFSELFVLNHAEYIVSHLEANVFGRNDLELAEGKEGKQGWGQGEKKRKICGPDRGRKNEEGKTN